MTEIIIMCVMSIGVLAIFLAALGVVRMPDFFLRLSVTVKAATLGIGMLLIGVAFYFGELAVTFKVMAIIFFLLLTSPVAAHMIARAAYFIETPLWDKSVLDELKGQYDRVEHTLDSGGAHQPQQTGGSENEKTIPPKDTQER